MCGIAARTNPRKRTGCAYLHRESIAIKNAMWRHRFICLRELIAILYRRSICNNGIGEPSLVISKAFPSTR